MAAARHPKRVGTRGQKSMAVHLLVGSFVCALLVIIFFGNSLKLWMATTTRIQVQGGASNTYFPPAVGPVLGSSSSSSKDPLDDTYLSSWPSSSLLNLDLIRSKLLAEAPWAESHGADHNFYLGAGMLYYSWAYASQARTIVVLGSGGGFVPRVLRQAQRDLALSGILGKNTKFRATKLYLIDAHLPQAGWGSTFYANNPRSIMAQEFPDITYLFELTDVAFDILQRKEISIDYLHIDADHSYKQSWKDFANYVKLLSPRGVVSFHDTCFSTAAAAASDEEKTTTQKPLQCQQTGVHDTLVRLQKLSSRYNLQVLDAHYLYNGIAFAIPKSVPSEAHLPVSKYWSDHFCRNNELRLNMASSQGFAHDGLGAMGTLGDFVLCSRRRKHDKPCPFGFLRRRSSDRTCSICIPGMIGDDCATYAYEQMRQREGTYGEDDRPFTGKTDPTLRFVASALEERHAQQVLQWGLLMPMRQSLSNYSWVQSPRQIVVIDPFVELPVWPNDNGKATAIRLLPCKLQDVIHLDYNQSNASKSKTRRLYQTLLSLHYLDALVCIDCDHRISNAQALQTLIQRVFHSLTTLILEGQASDGKDHKTEHDIHGVSRLDEMVELITSNHQSKHIGEHTVMSWQVESDIILQNHYSSTRRRLIVLYRMNTAVAVAAGDK